MTTINIVRLAPRLLSLNGSLGNSEVIATRLRWWGFDIEIHDVDPGQPLPKKRAHVIAVGHGTSSTLPPAAQALTEWAITMRGWMSEGSLALGSGLGGDLLGKTVTDLDGVTHEGLGLTDGVADLAGARASTEVAGVDHRGRDTAGYLNDAIIRQPTGLTPLLHFSSPAPASWQGASAPGAEGIVGERVWATALSGPVLALNPHLADDMIAQVLESVGVSRPEPTDRHVAVDEAATMARQRIRARLGLR